MNTKKVQPKASNRELAATIKISGEIERVLIGGDLSKLTEGDRIKYYRVVCKSLGLNPLTKPFDYITLNQKLVLYANKGCAEQLRIQHGVSVEVTAREKIEELFVVTTKATDRSGRVDSSTGAVNVGGLRGEAMANAMMKAETKSKRRVTLSICGLNMLDETEVETLPGTAQGAATTPTITGPAYSPSTSGSFAVSNPGDYVVQFGTKFKGIAIRDIAADDLRDYVGYLKSSAQEQKKQLGGSVREFVQNADAYLEHDFDPHFADGA